MGKFKEIIREIIPIVGEMQDKAVNKDEVLGFIDFGNPILEVGDISIFVIADDFASRGEKIAILANDYKLNEKYKYTKDVLLLDYKSNLRNLL